MLIYSSLLIFLQRISRSSENLESIVPRFGNNEGQWSTHMRPIESRIFEVPDKKAKQEGRNPPYEDDGPYSRRLFFPVKTKPSGQINMGSTFTTNNYPVQEKKTQILKKGLLWHKDDGILSRQGCLFLSIYLLQFLF